MNNNVKIIPDLKTAIHNKEEALLQYLPAIVPKLLPLFNGYETFYTSLFSFPYGTCFFVPAGPQHGCHYR